MSAPPFWFRPQRPAARLGLKGPDAARLLHQAGIDVPAVANAITHPRDEAGTRCLRLGNTEFLIEQDDGADTIDRVRTLAGTGDFRAWPVLRTDYCVLLGGPALFERMSHIAAFDFETLSGTPHQVVMTLAADISVTFVLDGFANAHPQLRLWADASFGTYLEQTLHTLSRDYSTASRHGDPT